MLLAAEARGNSSCSGLRPKKLAFSGGQRPKGDGHGFALDKVLQVDDFVLLGLQLWFKLLSIEYIALITLSSILKFQIKSWKCDLATCT